MTLFAFASTLEFSKMFPDIDLPESVQDNTDKVISLAVAGKNIGCAAILGVGLVEFSSNLARLLSQKEQLGISSVVLAGICGAYKNSGLQVGDVARVDRETVGDLGVEENDGSFTPWAKISGAVKTYNASEVSSAPLWIRNLRGASGLSVNCCTGTEATALTRAHLFNCDVESMEGAACFSICQAFAVPAYEIRAVSNYVGARDKSQWKIGEALEKLRELFNYELPITNY